nr:hypothetical protein Ade03nite_35270 [Actinoplanes derwentensis]
MREGFPTAPSPTTADKPRPPNPPATPLFFRLAVAQTCFDWDILRLAVAQAGSGYVIPWLSYG